MAGPSRPVGITRRGSVGSRKRAMAVGRGPRSPAAPSRPDAPAGADASPGANSGAPFTTLFTVVKVSTTNLVFTYCGEFHEMGGSGWCKECRLVGTAPHSPPVVGGSIYN